MSDWKAKIKNKKYPFVISVNNLTSSNLILKSEKLLNGKYYKKAKAISKVKPYDTEEMGLVDSPVGEWVWIMEDDPSHQFKMHISGKESKVVIDDLPQTATWVAEVQQEWDTPVPQIVLITTKREGKNSNTSSPFSSETSLPHIDNDGDKNKKKSKKSKGLEETGFSSGTMSKSSSFMSSSSEDSESDDFQPRKNRISLVIKDRSQIKNDDNNLQDLRSAVSRLSLGAPLNKNSISKGNGFFDELDKGRKQKEDEHLGKMRKSIIFHNDEREKRLAYIPEAAEHEFDQAIKHLESGNIDEASAYVNSALSQINDVTFKKEADKLISWCVYSQLISILCEMQRLESEKLFKQRALLARFASIIAFNGISNLEHKLICLRMGINRNMEIGNYHTAYELLNLMKKVEDLPDEDKKNIEIKMKICEEENLVESYPPLGIDSDDQFTINGKPYNLCMQAMRLIRENSHLVCEYCEATFSDANRSKQSKCLYCFSNLKSI